MKPKPRMILMFVAALIFGGSLALLPRGAQAQQELEVEIGAASPSGSEHSHKHDITVEDLKQGKTRSLLGSNPEDSHHIPLTRQQVADILDGTTIIVRSGKDKEAGDTKAHQHRVTITLTTEEPESSGW